MYDVTATFYVIGTEFVLAPVIYCVSKTLTLGPPREVGNPLLDHCSNLSFDPGILLSNVYILVRYLN